MAFQWKTILLSVLVAAIAYWAPLGLSPGAQTMLAITALVATLWISESLPLHVTALLVPALLVVFGGIKSKESFAPFFDPVIVLLLGGFVIAVALTKHGVDEWIAYKIIGRAGNKPHWVVLALIATATFISMWISNSATAAIIMPIAIVILQKNKLIPGKSNFAKAAVLAVAYGATIGGIGTIIGSTPNIIAAKFLNDSGTVFGFWEWFYRAFPFMLGLMIVAWIVLVLLFPSKREGVETLPQAKPLNSNQKKVLAIFSLTILLWVAESIHGISSEIIAIVPILLLYAFGLLETKDIEKVDWATLLLVGGGLSLGFGIHASGLDQVAASLISGAVQGQSVFILFLLLALFGVAFTSLISNTTAASIYLPIVVALAASFGTGVSNTVVLAAIGVSLDFTFAFGTPPTAIALGTGYVNSKEVAKAGIIISILGALLLAAMATIGLML